MEDMIMKKIYSYISLILAAGFINSCVEENLEPVNPSYREGEVIFSAASGFETGDKDTKTVYSGNAYTIDGVTYERIEWETGDKIKIYCHTGNNKQAADYSVGAATTSSNHIHTAVLNKHDEDNGIHWNGTDEHRFYAIYPSPTMPDNSDSKTTLEGKVDITYDESTETAILKGYVPTTQAPIEIVNNKVFTNGSTTRTAHYWAKPDMRYSYMVASTTASPNANGSSGVNLSFSAVATALEIEIVAPEATTISEVIIQSKSGAPLTGNFTCPIDQNGKPKTGEIQISEGASTVNIQLGSRAMEAGQVLRITALLLPVNVSEGDLNIIVQTDKFIRGNLGGVALKAHKKHYLTKVTLPTEQVQGEGNNWITVLPDNVLLRGLSIPGTSNSFSYNYGRTTTNFEEDASASSGSDYYMTQTKSFENQWNSGVRCFELVSDRSSSESGLGSESLRCNNQDLYVTFSQAFLRILQKIQSDEGKDEFAMIICTYQPTGTGPSRDPVAYMSQLKHFYDTYKSTSSTPDVIEEGKAIFTLYRPGLTIEDVRGTIMLIARPSQEGEDTDAQVTSAVAGEGYNILTIKGWGSLPDKWWRRGYDAKLYKGYSMKNGSGSIREDIREGYSSLPAMEDWIYGASGYGQGSTGDYYPYVTGAQKVETETEKMPTKDINKLRYNYSSDVDFNVWAQEWRRVFKETKTVEGRIRTGGFIIPSYTNYSYDFRESYIEKKSDISTTFERSIKDISGEYVYFNSLSGYYALTDGSQESYPSIAPYWMGHYGDIQNFSKDINTWFNEYISQKGEANITGSMGVTILDRVGETVASSDLTKIIIANNFKFALPTSQKYHAGSAEVEDWVDESLN